MAGNEGPGEGTYTTRHPCGGCRRGRVAWPGFEPTRRVKLTARTVSGRARRSPQPRWRSQQEHQRRSQRNTGGPANGTPVAQPQEPRRRGRRAGPTAPGTPVHSQQEPRQHSQQKHRRHSQQKHRWRSRKNTGAQPARTPAARQARRRVAASGPLRKDHLSLMRSSQVRRSPTRMPKSRFWSAMAASVAGFLMRAASTSGAAVMAPTP